MKDNEDGKHNVKEPFCPICIMTVPLAFSVSTGTLVASTTEEDCEEDEMKRRNNIVMGCVSISILMILIILYFYTIKCVACA